MAARSLDISRDPSRSAKSPWCPSGMSPGARVGRTPLELSVMIGDDMTSDDR